MADYRRTSRECTFEQLRPELVQALRDYAQQHELGDLASDALMCCETTSEKQKKGLFGGLLSVDPDPLHYIGAVVTPAWLIWARHGSKSGTVVQGARLTEIEVGGPDPQLRAMYQRLGEEHGLEVFGFVNRSPERVSAFIGFGPEPAAQKFKDTVKEAARQARAA